MHARPPSPGPLTAPITPTMSPILLVLLCIHAAAVANGEPPLRDREALLEFHSLVPHGTRLRWPRSSPTCSWLGVTCDRRNASILFLRLPGQSLRGPFPNSTLSLISSLRVISLHSNALSGSLPDLSSLPLLRSLYLHRNRFSSLIPASISRIPKLQRLDLSANHLVGPIPSSLSNLTRLTGLFLSNNSLSGTIPPTLDLPKLHHLSLANNSLNGSIPSSLSRFPASAFAGNLALCGTPLPPCGPLPTVHEKKHHSGLSTWWVVLISVAGALLFLILLLLIACCCLRNRRRPRGASGGGVPKSPGGPQRSPSGMTTTTTTGVPDKDNRLVFVGNGSTFGFDLEDLLRASAEVLGKGSAGTSYKAVLEDGATTVVVKRLKDVAASKREFEARMEVLGGVRHPNLAPLRAYYYSKDERLLVTDYLPGGSLSASLHGAWGTGLGPLDWLTRLRVARAAARGLSHLHREADVVHGNVKASNVLLRLDPDASALVDYGLSPLLRAAAGAQTSSRAAGYRAPELAQTTRPTAKSDVYSYGVVLLELLTGKAPQHAAAAAVGEDGVDLPRWVQSVVREEWTAEVFDAEMVGYGGGEAAEEEMVQLLQVAMACVSVAPDARPEMEQVERMVGEIAEKAEKREAGLKPSSEEEPTSKAEESDGVTPPATALGATP